MSRRSRDCFPRKRASSPARLRARVFKETANHHRSRNETEPAPATRHGRHNRLGHCVHSVAQTAPNRPVSAGISRCPATAHLACQSHFCASFASSFSFLRSERSQVRILPGALYETPASTGVPSFRSRSCRSAPSAACWTSHSDRTLASDILTSAQTGDPWLQSFTTSLPAFSPSNSPDLLPISGTASSTS